jgi:tetraacyldisaccharide 4'-kinase
VSVPGWLQDRVTRAGEADSPGDRLTRGLLTLASHGYGVVVAARNAAYDAGVLPVHRLACRVICVGNLTAGGTGKTPTVLALAQALVRAGATPCIVLRGYAGTRAEPSVVSDGRTVLLDWRQAGDEAVLLATRLPRVPVLVGADRVGAGRLALRRFGPDAILLDDGFQHRRLHRDVDLVLLDAADPFGGGRLLPRGRLREPLGALRRAHGVLVTHADRVADCAPLGEAIRRLSGGVPDAWARHRAVCLVDVERGAEERLETLEGRKVLAVCGIGRPASFLDTLHGLGAQLVGAKAFPDHHAFREEDRRAVADAASMAGAEWILTTEKDAVRLTGQGGFGRPTFALRIALDVIRGADALERLVGVRPGQVDRG